MQYRKQEKKIESPKPLNNEISLKVKRYKNNQAATSHYIYPRCIGLF